MLSSALVALSLISSAFARPTGVAPRLFGVNAAATTATTAISQDLVNSQLNRPAQFARVAYCNGDSIKTWTCGDACKAVSGIQVLQTGGDQGDVPFYYIAYDTSANTVVVAHEGTDPRNILSLANDAQFLLTGLNTTLFPNAPAGVEVHDGFQKTFERTSDGILAGVQNALQSTGATSVAVTGHSLGAALATMDAVMLSQQLDPSVQVSAVVFGLPRGGNQAWADFVDSSIGSSFSHVTNQHDPVPIVPPRLFGFQQPGGEIHITSVDASGQATGIVSCPGQDNENCSEGNSLISASLANHGGPYFNDISFGGSQCTSTAPSDSGPAGDGTTDVASGAPAGVDTTSSTADADGDTPTATVSSVAAIASASASSDDDDSFSPDATASSVAAIASADDGDGDDLNSPTATASSVLASASASADDDDSTSDDAGDSSNSMDGSDAFSDADTVDNSSLDDDEASAVADPDDNADDNGDASSDSDFDSDSTPDDGGDDVSDSDTDGSAEVDSSNDGFF